MNKQSVDIEEEVPEVPGAQALVRGLDLLFAVAAASEPPRFRDLQAEVGIPKGSLHRLLAALQSRRLVRYDIHTRRYSVGSRVLDLARSTIDQSRLIRAAKPELSRLARHLHRATCLYLHDGDTVFVLDFEDPDASESRVVRVWPRLPVEDSAPGLAILASLPPGERRARDGDPSIGLAQALGYTIVESEDRTRAWLAAPILEASGYPAGAICCVFEGPQADIRSLHEAGRLIAEGARRASSNNDMRAFSPHIQPTPSEGDSRGVELLETGRDFMGENPVYSAEENRLYWLDILAPALRWRDLATGDAGRSVLPDLVGGITLCDADSLILAGRHGLHRYDKGTGRLDLLIDLEPGRPDNRFNTASVDADGGLWAGTQAVENSPGHGSLYRVGRDLRSEVVFPEVGLPKNVAWSPDGGTLYYPDGREGCVYAFDTDDRHRLSNRRVLIAGDAVSGTPNGITVDREGCLWVAMVGSWSIRRFGPDGNLMRIVALPVPMPMNLTFGGPRLDRLYVTSTYLRLPPGFFTKAPQSGKLISVDAGVQGMPQRAFGPL